MVKIKKKIYLSNKNCQIHVIFHRTYTFNNNIASDRPFEQFQVILFAKINILLNDDFPLNSF